MINKLLLFTVLMLFFSMGIAQNAQTYYVDINSIGGSCSDSNSGTINNPLCSVSEALDRVNAGDIIYLRAGTYPPISMYDISGSEGQLITIQNYSNEAVLIDGSGFAVSYGINIDRSNYIKIEGLEVTGANGTYSRGGIFLHTANHNFIINNHVHHNGVGDETTSGIKLYSSSDNLIQDNHVHHNNFSGIHTSSDNNDSSNHSTQNKYINNEVHDNTGSGGNSDGIGFNGIYTYDCVISGNLVYNNSDDGIDTWITNGHDIIGNISYNNGIDGGSGPGDGNGFKLGGNASGANPGFHYVTNNISYGNTQNGFVTNGSGGSSLYHNVAYGNAQYGFSDFWRTGEQNAPVSFRNNIAMNNTDADVRINTSYTTDADYNIYYQDDNNAVTLNVNGNAYNSTNIGSYLSNNQPNSLNANPLFVNPTVDFHLQSGSPAIDAGDPSVSSGYEGNGPDMGAYEYEGSNCPPAGTPCDDGNPATENDVEDGFCNCAGTPVQSNCELLSNGSFESDLSGWDSWNCDVDASGSLANITNIIVDIDPWDAGFFQKGMTIEQGKTYTLTFRARASSNRSITFKAGTAQPPYISYFYEERNLSTSMQNYSHTFTMNETTDTDASLEFFFGHDAPNVYIDDVSLVKEGCNNCPPAGTSCDDGNPNTINDVEDGFCNCAGTPDSRPDNYCNASANNTNYEYIQQVIFGNINNNSGDNGGFGDFISQIADVGLGDAVPFGLTPGFPPGNIYNEVWKIWIDFNRDGDYTDAGEEVYSGEGMGALSGNVNIPATASLGLTGMRVAMQWNRSSASCGTFTYGEVEDYTVNILSTSQTYNVSPPRHDQNVATTPSMRVYPNPVNDMLNIGIQNASGEGMIKIYDLAGKPIGQQIINEASTDLRIEVGHLLAGTYIIRLELGKGIYATERFIKLSE